MISEIAKRIVRRALPAGFLVVIALGPLSPVPASGATAVQTPPIPAGEARVWFMRELTPGMSNYSPKVYADGVPIGISPQSTMFYRDVAAGTHVFDVENCTPQPASARTLNLSAGEQVSLQVTALQDTGGWDCSPKDTYYLSPIPAHVQQWYFARLTNLGSR